MKNHLVKNVMKDSIAAELGIAAGDVLLEINGLAAEDMFDYQFMTGHENIELLIRKPDGEEWLFEIEKDENEDVGLIFDTGLMDEYRSCRNNCIFCFIDQMPPGMRETLYFKDDDARLSFLQGNYITLTNLSDADIERLIRYRLSPINISVHTTDAELRCRMLRNQFAGEALGKMNRLYEAGIRMNGQIVLCKGVNDGAHLEKSIHDLSGYLPYLESVSVVPAGLTRFRETLYPLEKFTAFDADKVLALIHAFRERVFMEHGVHFVHASDEWYLLSGRELPAAHGYDGYPQLENGVGMLRLFWDEFEEALGGSFSRPPDHNLISVATGLLAYPHIEAMAARLCEKFPGLMIHVYGLKNDFFGENITVSGLLTGKDIIGQLKGKELGARLLLPENVLRSGEDVFLDGLTVKELERALQVRIDIVKSSGRDFVEAALT